MTVTPPNSTELLWGICLAKLESLRQRSTDGDWVTKNWFYGAQQDIGGTSTTIGRRIDHTSRWRLLLETNHQRGPITN